MSILFPAECKHRDAGSFSLGVLDGAFAKICHFGVLDFLLVQLVLSPQQQFEEFGKFRCRLPVFIVQHRLVYLAPHLL